MSKWSQQWRAAALPAGVFLLGLGLSASAALWLRGNIEQEADAEFRRSVERVSEEVVRRFRKPVYGLNGAKALHASRPKVGRDEFRAFVASRDLAGEFPGVRGFGFIQRVQKTGLEAFLAAERADGAPNFSVRQLDDTSQADLYVIRQIEPRANNIGAEGLDVGSERLRRIGITTAVDSAEATITAPIALVQANRKTPGVLLYVPVYLPGSLPATPEDRRAALVGVLYAPIVISELLADLSEVAYGQVDVELLDTPGSGSDGAAVFDSRRAVALATGTELPPYAGRHVSTDNLVLPGRVMSLRLHSTPKFDVGFDTLSPKLLFAGGALASLLLALLLRQMAGGRLRAEALAGRMTADLGRLALVAQRTSNAVIITDPARRITWVNEGFERLSGYTAAEVMGRSPGLLLQFEDTDPATRARMRAALDSMQAFTGELLNRAKNGTVYWVELEIQPLHGEDGSHTGFMAIESDISERRAVTAALDSARSELSRLAMVAERTSNAVIITDRELRITWVNDGFTRLYGFTYAQALGQTARSVLGHPDCPPQALDTLRSSAAAGLGCRVELLNRCANGHEVWVDTEVQPTFDDEGSLIGFIQIASDITASRQGAAELALERQRLDRIIRGTQAGTWETDLQTGAARVNTVYAAMLGRTVEELMAPVDQSFMALVHAEDRAAVSAARSAHLQGLAHEYDVEFRMRHKDGHWIWVQSRGKVSERDAQGQPLAIAGIHLDISARKAAERELARGRQRLANILDGTHVGTWEWNVESGETIFNERWAQIIGCTLAELGTTTIETWRRCAHPEDLNRSAVLLDSHFNGETENYECEARLRHKDGHWVWVLARGKLFSRSDDGRPRWMAGTHMDITERKQAEAALRDSQAFLRQTGRIGGVGGWELTLATQAVHWTEETRRIHEVAPDYQPTLEGAIDFYAPEARPVIEQAVAEALASGQGWDLELPFNTATGRAIWVRAVGEAEFLDGQPVRLIGAFQDITARRALEAELRAKNELVSNVLENLPCGLSVFNADLELVAVNGEFKRLLDFPESLFESGHTRFEDVIRFNAARGEYGSVDVETTVRSICDLADKPTVAHQFERVRPDGTPLEVRGAPMPGGGFVTTYTNISARKQAEAEVRRSAALLRGAIEAIDEAFVLFDPDDRLVLCNDKYREIYASLAYLLVPGASFEHIVRLGAERGDYVEAIGRVDEWVAERVAAHRAADSTLTQKLSNGRTLRIIERKLPDGHIVGFRIDITELVQATEAAQQASLSKSQFLANMSHEIRTPMNAILGMLALLRKTELTARQADYAGKTAGAARSLLGLLNDILDFSKVEAGKMTLDPHPFRIDQLLRDLSVILSANAGSKPIEVLFDIDPALPRHLVGDAMRMQQVLINLGGNAIKFTSEGEVVVSVSTVVLHEDAVTVEIAVRDTGIGIAPENQARIFSGFTQAEASTTRRFGGTGLGVAISQRLVGLMGGTLQLDSALGAGSRFHFRVTLPLAPAIGDDEPVRSQPAEPLRALVVDDNPTARAVLERMSRSLGWVVDVAASGEQALARLQAQVAAGVAYQAVFIDWQMPGLDGWATTERIRELGLAAGAPVVVMVTAHGREMLEQRSADEQGLLDGFLVKPITASMLFDAVVDARSGHEKPRPSVAAPSGGKSLAGLRLLLVEDNLNNQQVARELLEDEGALVQIANHGQEAVEAVAAAEPAFDVVLMDLQMPVMDGFTATRKIRQDLGQTALPIIAMTANAMASDREACLAAGMNDHVGKPFDLNHLIGVLRRHAGRVDDALAAPAALPPAAALADSIAAAALAAGVDLRAALARLGGKQEVYARMLRTFVGDLASMPEQLGGFLAVGQPEGAARLLHTLKGLAATLGAVALADCASTAEKRMADAPQPTEAAAAIAAAIAVIHGAGPGLAALLQALQPPASTGAGAGADPPAHDPAALRAGLRQLADLLRNSDMGAMDAWAGLQQRFAGDLGARMQALDDAVSRLEFEPALQHCNDLIEACAE